MVDRTLEFFIHQFIAFFSYQTHHQGCPTGLMRGTEAFAGFAVEVFVEEDEILPIRIVGLTFGDLAVAVAWTVALFVFGEQGDESVTKIDGDFA